MLCNLCYEKKSTFYLDCYCVFCEECYDRKIKYYIQKDQKQNFEKKKRKCRFCQRITNYKKCDSRIASDLLTIKQLNLHPERANLRAVETSKFHFLQKKKNIKFLVKKTNFLLEMVNFLVEKNKMINLDFPETLKKKDNFGIIKKLIKKYKTFSFDNNLGSENPNMMEIEYDPTQLEEIDKKEYFEKNDRNQRKRFHENNKRKEYFKNDYYKENSRNNDYDINQKKRIYEENKRNSEFSMNQKKRNYKENKRNSQFENQKKRNYEENSTNLNYNKNKDKSRNYYNSNNHYNNNQNKKINNNHKKISKSITENSRIFYDNQNKENINSKNRRNSSRVHLSNSLSENNYGQNLNYNGDNTKKYFGFKLKGIRDSANSKKRNSSSRRDKYRLQNILLKNSNYATPIKNNRYVD